MRTFPMSPRTLPALVAVHAAVALFGFAALFGTWLAWPPTSIVLGRTVVAALTLGAIAIGARSLRAPGPGLALNGLMARPQ